jgi:hypothetical protein
MNAYSREHFDIYTMDNGFKGNLSMDNNSMQNVYNNHHVQQLLEAYGQWVHDHMAYGWDGYLLSFMFDQIKVPEHRRMEEMKKHLGWFYGRLAEASVPKASSPRWSSFLPRAVLSPDLPVFKYEKQQLRDVTINNGLHWHGPVLVNPLAPKLPGNRDVHINENLGKYLVGSIRTIGVEPITNDPVYVTGYGMKGLKRSTFSEDDVLIFPRTVSELPSNGPVRVAGEKPVYDFQRE